MKHIGLILFALIGWMGQSLAQDISVKGVVMEEHKNGTLTPMDFVNVYWQKSTNNTTTDSTGYFFIAHDPEDGDKLIVQFLGYTPDTIKVKPGQYLSVVFKEKANTLDEVVVAYRKRSTEVSFLDPLQVQSISKEELFKAACCNLSESFETNATVDVSFTDAVTGAKQIQMLGLSGKYTLLSQEQMPGVRGIATPFGMLYTPGAWIESIQISKGAGSVVQGYESITGQINVELKKPSDEDKLLVNGYFNESSRAELNLFSRAQLSPMFSTAFLGHYSGRQTEHDRNNDGFLDMPKGSLLTLANRWDYYNNKSGVEGKLNVQWVQDRKEGGETSHQEHSHPLYSTSIDGDRIQVYAKLGYVFSNKRYNSLGSQWGFTRHTQNATIGNYQYDAGQTSLYGNWLYQSILSDSRHKYVTGISFRYEDYAEKFRGENYDFKEIVPGAFFEYTYLPDDRLTVVAGIRADHHNLYDLLINPRIHLRYAPGDKTVFRLSGGSGMRTPLPIAENLGWMASSREWTIGTPGQTKNDYPYNGLEMEKAWNFGASITQEFTIDYRSGLIAVDFFHTRFKNRAISDLDVSPQQLIVYNLNGKSYASTFQVEAQYEILKRVDLKVAYKLQDAQITYQNTGLRNQIFTPQSRFFTNLSYVSSLATYKGHWRINATAHYTGKQRIPDTFTNPEAYQLKPESPGYWLFNAQLTRVFNKQFEIYVGAENIGNFKQSPVIVDAENPFSPYFDSGLIWGPIFGREWYVGFRYILK